MLRLSRNTMSQQRRLTGVIFDLDGTLTAPDAIDFARMRARCGFPTREKHGGSILKLVEALPTQEERDRCHAIIKDEEAKGMLNMKLNHGMEATLQKLEEHGLKAAIVTRNNTAAIDAFAQMLSDQHQRAIDLFHPQLARDASCPATGRTLRNKPHADPALSVLHVWQQLHPDHHNLTVDDETCLPLHTHGDVLFVGDHLDDLRSGRRAGCKTALITNRQHEDAQSHAYTFMQDPEVQHYADFVVHDGMELAKLLDDLVRIAD
eukprot:TRINITY_DN6009_c0_g1_i1.p1 TRINITY_DN6009_c0_g1~~TRINITY_DN6009_c0_g1_i1.p1  ORF type:complete len:263 (+),score=50.66 TRINITY_DN6009_c0_g1_i1:56-844(+)